MPDPQQAQTPAPAPPPQQTLAQLVKSKYPGAYDDMDDATLEKSVLAKHPEYSDLPKTQIGPPAGKGLAGGVGASSDQQGFLSHVGQSLKGMVPTQTPGLAESILGPIVPAVKSLYGAGQEAIAARGRGHGLPYSAAAGASTLVGVNPGRMEAAAEQGDTSGVLGEAAVPAVAAVLPSVLSRVPWGKGARVAGNTAAEQLRYPATARQSQLGRPGTVKNILPSFLQKYTVPESLIPKGEVGTPTNPGPFMEIPAKMPKAAAPESTPIRQSPYFDKAAYQAGLKGEPTPAPKVPWTEVPSEEGVSGSVPKPSGRLVVLPQEEQALNQMQKIATKRASEHGMQYAAGMRPAGGGRVPATPTKTMTTEFPGARPTPFSPALKMETDSLGIRWAVSPNGYRVSIPRSVPDEAAAAYAEPKLAEQAQIHSSLPWTRKSQQ